MVYKLLLFFCLYLPFQIALNPTEGIDLASGRIFIILLFLIWLINGLKNKRVFIPNKVQTLLILSFLFISALSLFWAENLDWGVRKLLFLLSIFPVYFVAAGLSGLNLNKSVIAIPPEREKQSQNNIIGSVKNEIATVAALPRNDNFKIIKIVKFLVWGAGLAAIVGIIQFLLQFIVGLDRTAGIWRNYVTPLFLGKSFTQAVLEYPSWLVNIGGHNFLRAFSTFPDPHMFSFYLGLALPLAIGLYFYAKNKCPSELVEESNPIRSSRRFAPQDDKKYLIIFFVILLADLLTFSRGGYAGLIAGFIFAIFYFVLNKKVNPRKILVSLVLILVIFVSLALTPVGKRFYASFSASEGSNKERFENWNQAVEVIKNNPLGVGIGNYSYEIEPSAGYRKPIYAHNLYLDIAAETGIANAIIWIALLFYSIRNFIKKAKYNILYLGGAASLMIFSVHSIFDTALYSVQVLPLLLIIIALDVSDKLKRV